MPSKYAYRQKPEKRNGLAHRVVWEEANGPIPQGQEVHHINENKKDNRLENLTLITPSEHRRLHRGWSRIGDEWWKPCKGCAASKPESEFTRSNSLCRPCNARRASRAKGNIWQPLAEWEASR